MVHTITETSQGFMCLMKPLSFLCSGKYNWAFLRVNVDSSSCLSAPDMMNV